jgi:hypothetical protein
MGDGIKGPGWENLSFTIDVFVIVAEVGQVIGSDVEWDVVGNKVVAIDFSQGS